MAELTNKDKRTLEEYNAIKKRIHSRTAFVGEETPAQKTERITKLKADFFSFAKYYFLHYMTDKDGTMTDFGWFHRLAVKLIQEDTLTVLEWAREHAKSVFADVMLPMYLYHRGDLTGMVVASANQDKAEKLLSDVQAEFESNQRLIADFGNLVGLGSWQTGQFSTTDGIGFWSFGIGQSPRGIREQEKRPNYCVVDDADTKERCKNESRVLEAVAWIREDLIGAMGLTSGVRVVIAGNRIHKKSIVAHLVGDIEPQDPKNEGVQHIKVFAIENPRTHAKAELHDPLSKPAWIERYTKAHFEKRFLIIGYRASRREYFHEHVEEGTVFKAEWIQWAKSPKIEDFDELVCYTDPSFTNNKNSDYKAVVLMGSYRHPVTKQYRYHIRKAWVRQASVKSMVKANYDVWKWVGNHARYYIESNMLQVTLLDEFDTEGSEKKDYMPITGDGQKKADKFTRIENMTPIFERGIIEFAEDQRTDPDMQTLIDQIIAFPTGHDDGPDATQGAYSKLRSNAVEVVEPRTGKHIKKSSRM